MEDSSMLGAQDKGECFKVKEKRPKAWAVSLKSSLLGNYTKTSFLYSSEKSYMCLYRPKALSFEP
jgi:hypothetical protein